MSAKHCFLLIILASPITAKNFGAINVAGYGDVYVVAGENNSGNIQMHDNGFTLVGGGGIHFAKEARDDFSPEMYWAVSDYQDI